MNVFLVINKYMNILKSIDQYDENYVFFNGTVKHGYAQPERQFSMNGVT